jgi:hypothetical protein
MLRVTVELLPHGSEDEKRRLAVIDIANDGTGDALVGNYDVRAEGETIGGGVFGWSGKVSGVRRGDALHTAAECMRAAVVTNSGRHHELCAGAVYAAQDGRDAGEAGGEREMNLVIEMLRKQRADYALAEVGLALKLEAFRKAGSLSEHRGYSVLTYDESRTEVEYLHAQRLVAEVEAAIVLLEARKEIET